MIPGLLIKVKQHRHMLAYLRLFSKEEPGRYDDRFKLPINSGMICMTVAETSLENDKYIMLLIGEQICYIHDSLYNPNNFEVLRDEAP